MISTLATNKKNPQKTLRFKTSELMFTSCKKKKSEGANDTKGLLFSKMGLHECEGKIP